MVIELGAGPKGNCRSSWAVSVGNQRREEGGEAVRKGGRALEEIENCFPPKYLVIFSARLPSAGKQSERASLFDFFLFLAIIYASWAAHKIGIGNK